MKVILCILIGYFIGSLSPAALISKLKHKDIRKSGTGNLGATNTMLAFGKMLGFLVMILDIFKGFFAFKIAMWTVPEVEWSAMLAGFAAVLGHCFPFYLKFKGGKGLAALGGFVLAVNPVHFMILLPACLSVALILNYACFLPLTATVILPFVYGYYFKSLAVFGLIAAVCAGMFFKFLDNVKKINRGEEPKLRDFIKKYIFKTDH